MADIFGKELYFNLDKNNNISEEKIALAQTVQNLCLIEPGTYPNNPDLGLGIENYEFEFLDNTTINRLKTELEEQISKFIITKYVINSNILTTKYGNKNLLIVAIKIADDNNDGENYTENDEPINIVFGKDNKKKILSQIIL